MIIEGCIYCLYGFLLYCCGKNLYSGGFHVDENCYKIIDPTDLLSYYNNSELSIIQEFL